MPITERLGLIPGFGWLIDQNPFVAGLLMLLISPLGLMFIRLVVEFRVVRPSDEFQAFKADTLFAVVFANAVALVRRIPGNHVLIHRSPLWVAVQIVVVLACIGLCVIHYYKQKPFYSRAQRWSPTALYHTVVLYVLIGFPLSTVGLTGLIVSPWDFLGVEARLVILAAFGVWAKAVAYDYKHPLTRDGLPKFDMAHDKLGWPWQHKYRRAHFMWWYGRAMGEYRDMYQRARRIARI